MSVAQRVQDATYIADKYWDKPALYVPDMLLAEPDTWQGETLEDIVNHDRIAVASGHGIGKTALTSWIIHWFLSTRAEPQIVVTANTQTQLTSKTWRELAKWNHRARNGDWYKWTATRFFLKDRPATWFASAIPWSEGNSEAFAGTHEKNILYLFDEASAIADIIWEVSEGAMTTEGAKWIVFGNPTRNSGRFKQCFTDFKHRWHCKQIDSRTVSIVTNKEQVQQWVEDYGDDSDFVRVRVKGQFPRISDAQFISEDVVIAAQARTLPPRAYANYPRIMGADVARGGGSGNRSTIIKRQGPKVHEPLSSTELDTMEFAGRIAEEYHRWHPQAICVDGTGVGAGVVDRLKQLKLPVVDILVGQQAVNPVAYSNLRSELWGNMRDWIAGEVDLPQGKDLRNQFTSIEYGYTRKMQVQLERKKDLIARGEESPDEADALSLTFANYHVTRRSSTARPVRLVSSRGWT